LTVDLNGRSEGPDEARSERFRVTRQVQPSLNDGEFVPVEPGNRVDVANMVSDSASKGSENLIACRRA
jgi:hypothetical protein